MRKIFKSLLILVFLCSGVIAGYGQYSFNSPYSSLGLGDITFKGFARNRALGGITTALRNPAYIDFANPAALSVRDTLSFIFDFGGTGKASYLADPSQDHVPWDFNFSHLAFSFPITRNIAVAGGVVPFSLVEYQFGESVREGDPLFMPEVGAYDYFFRGEGGLNQVFLGSGFNLTKNIALGLEVNYIFGNLKRVQSITFLEINNPFHPKIDQENIVSGFNFNFGGQYHTILGKDLKLVIGGHYAPSRMISENANILKTNNLVSSGGATIADTIIDLSTGKTKSRFPSSYALGLSINKANKFIFGLEYKTSNWAESTIMGNDSLLTSRSFHAGMELTPDPRRLKSYLSQIHYRIGGYYNNSFLQIDKEQINDFGITFGVGLPIPQSRTTLNIAFEVGKRGKRNDKLILEDHAAITFSLTMYEFWFQKRKYD